MTVVIPASSERLLELLRRYAFEKRKVTLSSGKESDFYIDCKQVSLLAEGHFLIGQLGYSVIRQKCPNAVSVGGLTMGADPIASAISLTSFIAGHPLPAFYVRKEPKSHGTNQWVEGLKGTPTGAEVVVIEDVVTTGKSAIAAIERVTAAGMKVAFVLTLVDREDGGREAIEQFAPLHALYSRKDFMS